MPGNPDSAGFATLDLGRDHGALLIAELDFAPAGTHEIAVGAWTYTAPTPLLSGDAGFVDAADAGPAGTRGNRGAYAFVDAPLGAVGAVRLDGLLRVGMANARYNAVETYVGAAVVANNLLETRPYDALGIAVAHGRTGRAFRNGMLAAGTRPAPAETAIEMTWRTQLLTSLSLAPSLQWAREEVIEVWPSDLADLFARAGMPRRAPPAAGDCGDGGTTIAATPPRITSPLSGVSYTLRAGRRAEGRIVEAGSASGGEPDGVAIRLAAIADGTVGRLYWFADDAFIATTGSGEAASWQPPGPGQYTLTVVDDRGGSDSRPVRIALVP